MSKKEDVQRLPAEQLFQEEIDALIKAEKNPSAFANRIRYINYILKDIPISETELKKQLEEIIEMDKKAKRASINLCKDWLEKLNNGAKVKEL